MVSVVQMTNLFTFREENKYIHWNILRADAAENNNCGSLRIWSEFPKERVEVRFK